MKKAALHNLGCKVNAYETEAMQILLEQAGYGIVPFSETADVYVINTCSVTNIADRKSRQMIHRARKQNPDAVIVAAGCYVQTKEAEANADPAVDILIGNNKKGELVEKIEELAALREKQNAGKTILSDTVDINAGEQPFEELFLTKTSEHTRAFIKVQDGCNQFCSYCIIPYARGRIRSRAPQQVQKEVEALAKTGCKEIVLTGIHLSSYGLDNGGSLLSLIREIHDVDGIGRIRLGSLEPRLITEEFAKSLAGLEKICPHFHLSLQSGCDATLARMNRRYTTKEYEDGCNILRDCFQNPAITTDVIVGFPGETEEEFSQTEAFLERIRFYGMHIFKYSRRQGTRAAAMPNQVPEEVKNERSLRLLALDGRMSAEFRRSYLGTEQEVLFEELATVGKKQMYVGYTREYVKVAAESGENLINCIVRGKIAGEISGELYRMEVAAQDKGCFFGTSSLQ